MSLREKIIFISVFIAAVVLLFFSGVDQKKEQVLQNAKISGQIIKTGHWNNYGYQVKLLKNKETVATARTSLNGSFIFQQIKEGDYQMMVFDRDIFLFEKAISVPQTDFLVRLPAKASALIFFDFVVLIINIVLLVVGILFFLNTHSRLAVYYLIMLAAPFVYNTIELLQNILAFNGQEILAANIAALKLIGLIFFGQAFFSFFRELLAKKPLPLSSTGIIYVAMGVETVILLSMLIFNNDVLFQNFWHFPFPIFRNFLILQTFVGFDLGLKNIYRGQLDHLSREMANRLQFMFFAVLFTIIFLSLMVFGPVMFFEKEIFPFTFSISLASIIMFGSFFYGLRGYRVPYVGYVINRSIVLTIFSFILVVIYSALIIFLEDRIDSMNFSLIDSYLIFLLFIIFIPFLNILVKSFNQLVFKNVYRAIDQFKSLSKDVLCSINTREIAALTCSAIPELLTADKADIFLRTEQGFVSPLTKKSFTKNTGDSDDRLCYEIKIGSRIKGYLLVYGIIIAPDKLLEDRLYLFLDDLAIALSNASMHEQITRMNDKILRTEKILAQENKLSTLGLMSARLAHEIKNPLGILQNMTATLPAKKNDKVYFAKFMEIVPRQLSRIDEMLKTLLDYSRPRELHFEILDLTEIFRSLLSLLQPTLQKKKIKVELSVKAVPMTADRSALEQVFLNLLLNAIEAIAKPGGKIRITVNADNDKNIIKIKDSGKGISSRDKQKIFDPFFTTKKSGNGLGLATVLNIITAHHGQIKLNSKVGAGTEFVIELPTDK